MENNITDLKKLKEYTKDMRVLYVEDDKMIQREVNEYLKRFFQIVDLANNGQDGLKQYKKEIYDLIISDINMPKMNGIEMSKAILKDTPSQSIIINSAYNESKFLLELINSGIIYYVLKPINIKQFTKIIYEIAEFQHNKKITQLYNESIKKQNIKLEKSLQEKNEIITTQAFRNNLTGLDNLCALIHNIKENNQKENEFTALILLDIDNLGHINDLYGVDIGNNVLISFSKMLKKFSTNKSYKIFHTSGDQFIMIEKIAYIDTEKYETDLEILLKKIENFTFYINDKNINISATIGMSLGQELPMEHADMALKSARKHHKFYSVYNTLLDTTKEMQEKIKWHYRITKALEGNNIVPVYQAIVDKDGVIVKYESLMRILEIEDGKEKLISPDNFINIAIDNKLYDMISRMMINKVLYFLKTNEHTISINLSYSDIGNKIFMEDLYKKIKNNNIGGRLIVEITENENILDYKLLKTAINKFRHLGVKIAIDDFGSGYSNFNQVLEICPEYIKIDRTLIENIDINSRAFILTKAITNFSKELGFKVIAEYVHNKEIFNILKKFNIDEYQGYFFSEPQRNI